MAAIDLSVVASAVAVGVGAYAALLRYTLKSEKKTVEDKIAAAEDASKSAHNAMVARTATLEADLRSSLARVVENEKAIIRQDGAIALLKQAHDTATATLEELKRQQVPRAEWERQMTSVVKTLDQILERLDAYEVRAQASGRG